MGDPNKGWTKNDRPLTSLLLHSFDYPPLGGGISRLCRELVEVLSRDPQRRITVLTGSRSHKTPSPGKEESFQENQSPLQATLERVAGISQTSLDKNSGGYLWPLVP